MVGDTPETDVQGARPPGNRAGLADREADTGVIYLAAHVLGVLAADASHRCVPKWLGLPGRRAPAAPEIPAAETEPPQVNDQLVAQIQWHRTLVARLSSFISVANPLTMRLRHPRLVMSHSITALSDSIFLVGDDGSLAEMTSTADT